MRNKRMKLQIAAIYIIIITALVGSALFFFYLNTDAMMRAVELETRHSASFLASALRDPEGLEAIDALLPEVLRETEDIDVWVLGADGGTLFTRGGRSPRIDWSGAVSDGEDSVLLWSGRRSPFRLNQELFLKRVIPETGYTLILENHCSAANATQRRQFALFSGIELVLICTMLILLVNTFHAYRRQLILLATTDELTGLANRKSFQNAFREFTEKQKPPPFSLFLADVDCFKQVNDTHGHAAGDKALQVLAGRISAMVDRCGGFAGRWGGDEFIGVLPLSGEEALEALRELCQSVRGVQVEEDLSITISAGVAPSDGELSLSRLSEKADQALYVSKARGRDRANLYDLGQAPMARPAAVLNEGEAAEAVKEKAVPAAVKAAAVKEAVLPLKARLRRWVREKLLASTLNGVKWMAPFVAGGGILIGLAFLFDASSVDLTSLPLAERADFGSITHQASVLKTIGGATFNFMLPVFAGFMAYSFAGEDAFMAGFVGGYMTIESQSGFIGAMLAGLSAGLITSQMQQFTSRMPKLIQKAAPIVIYPVFNLLLMQGLSWLVITPVSSTVGRLFRSLLDRAAAESSVAAGALSGSMMAMDMGGIINKVAYNYGVSGLAEGKTVLMASVMAGGMTPPLGLALSVLLFGRKYRQEERDRVAGTLFMGLSFITEGALPFVFTDFLRVIPSCMVGSALAGMLSALYDCSLPAPHGGVFVLPVMEHPLFYILAIGYGSLATAVILGLWKPRRE